MERTIIIDIDPESSINKAPPSNALGAFGWMGKFAESATSKPLAVKKNELELLSTLEIKRQTDSHTFPTRSYTWKDTETWPPLPSANAIGKMIAKRLGSTGRLSTWTNLQTDANAINYLADIPPSTFLGASVIQNTPDTGESLRRERIVGMLRAFEASYVSKNGIPEKESEWAEMYINLYHFMDPENASNSYVPEGVASWVRTYAMYYIAVWNYVFIDPFEEANLESESEVKFRGFLNFILNLPEDRGAKLLERFEQLDKSTNMKAYNCKVSPSFNIQKSLLNYEGNKIVRK